MGMTVDRIRKEIKKVVVGQDKMIDGLIIGLACDGHILLEGVPGLAKTTTVNALSKALGLDFKRVQFTPDLLPSDIIGAEIYDPKNNSFKIKQGPSLPISCWRMRSTGRPRRSSRHCWR